LKLIKDGFKEQESKIKELVDEREYYKLNYYKLKPQLDDTRNKLKIYSEEYSKLQKSFEERKAISQRNHTNLTLSYRNDSKNSFVAEKGKLETKLNEAESTIFSLKDKVNKKKMKIQELQNHLQQQNKSIEELEEKCDLYGTKIKENEIKSDEMKDNYTKLNDRLKKKDNTISNLNEKINSLNKIIEEQKVQLKEDDDSRKKLEGAYRELSEQYERFKDDEISNKEKADEYKNSILKIEEIKYQELLDKFDRMKKEENTYKEKVSEFEKSRQKLEEENKKSSEENLSLQNDIQKKERDLMELNKNIEMHKNRAKDNTIINIVKDFSILQKKRESIKSGSGNSGNILEFLQKTTNSPNNSKKDYFLEENKEVKITTPKKDTKDKEVKLFAKEELKFPEESKVGDKNEKELLKVVKEATKEEKKVSETPKEEKKVNDETTKPEKTSILTKLEKKQTTLKLSDNKPARLNLNSKKLDIGNKFEIKSPTAERNLNRKESGNSLNLMPSIQISAPIEDDKFDIKSNINVPFSYQLLVQESEPQICNPAHTFFVKSGMNSKKPSKLDLKKVEKNKDNVENELDKILTERIKNGEDFDTLFQEFNIKNKK